MESTVGIAPPRLTADTAAATLCLNIPRFVDTTMPARSINALRFAVTSAEYTGEPRIIPSASKSFWKYSQNLSSVKTQFLFPRHPMQPRQGVIQSCPSCMSSVSMPSFSSSSKTILIIRAVLPSLRTLPFIPTTFIIHLSFFICKLYLLSEIKGLEREDK